MAYHGPLDLDRGVTMRFSRLNPEVGVIAMIKDDPGKYYDQNGNEVSEGIARLAGFDTETNARIRFLAEKRAEFDREMAAEYAKASGKGLTVIETRGGFSLVELSNGRHNVVDLDGQSINPQPLTVQEATRLLNMLAPLPQAKAQADE